MVCSWRKVHWVLEQPANSCLQHHPRMQQLLKNLYVIWLLWSWEITVATQAVLTYKCQLSYMLTDELRCTPPNSTWVASMGPLQSSTSCGLAAECCWSLWWLGRPICLRCFACHCLVEPWSGSTLTNRGRKDMLEFPRNCELRSLLATKHTEWRFIYWWCFWVVRVGNFFLWSGPTRWHLEKDSQLWQKNTARQVETFKPSQAVISMYVLLLEWCMARTRYRGLWPWLSWILRLQTLSYSGNCTARSLVLRDWGIYGWMCLDQSDGLSWFWGCVYLFCIHTYIYICDMNPGHMPIPCRPTCLCASAIWLAASTRAYREGGKLGWV